MTGYIKFETKYIRSDIKYIKFDISKIIDFFGKFNIYYIMTNDIKHMIYTAASSRNSSVREIARLIGMTPSNLYRKVRQNTIKPCELEKIAKILGGEYAFYFYFPNGSKIGNLEKSGRAKKKQKNGAKAV